MIIYSNFGDLILIIYNANKKVHSLEKEKKHGALIDLRARPPQVKISYTKTQTLPNIGLRTTPDYRPGSLEAEMPFIFPGLPSGTCLRLMRASSSYEFPLYCGCEAER